MEKVMQQKIFKMLHSTDKEISNLGIEMLRGAITTWQEFKMLRGLSIQGRSFFPHKLRIKIKKFGTELRANGYVSKHKRRKAYFEYANRLGSGNTNVKQ